MTTDIIREYVLYNGLNKMVGLIDEFRPPSLKVMVEMFRGAGMDAPIPIDMGMEALEAGWTCSGIDRATYVGFGLITALPVTVMVRGAAVNAYTGIPVPVVHTFVGKTTTIEPSAWKAGERATVSATIHPYYYKLEHTIPGLPAVEIDIPNGIRIINAVDQLLALRIITGR